MEKIFISKKLINEQFDIEYSHENRKFIKSNCTNNWCIGDIDADLSIDALAALSNIKIDVSPEKKFVNAVKSLTSADVRWLLTIPAPALNSWFSNLYQQSVEVLNKGCIEYYNNVFKNSRKCLQSLEKACIDEKKLKLALEDGNDNSLKSFLNYDDEYFLQSPRYDQFSTITGRLTINDGPQILTLTKKHKNIIRSRYDGGKIVSYDFRSLEPRVALAHGNYIDDDDVYEYIKNKILNDSLDRQTTKIVVISLLYGASLNTVSKVVGTTNTVVLNSIKKIKDFFKVEQLEEKLLNEARKNNDVIHNAYGRMITVNDRKKVINYYNQSTAVDLALISFYEAIKWMKGKLIHPIYVIHDALIVDCHPDEEVNLLTIKEIMETSNRLNFKFPVEMGVLCC